MTREIFKPPVEPAWDTRERIYRCTSCGTGDLPAGSIHDCENPVIVPAPPQRKHPHYFRDCPYDQIDVYRVLYLFDVVDPCLQHAVKKLLAAGQRGLKDAHKDISEAIETLQRWQEMRDEEGNR